MEIAPGSVLSLDCGTSGVMEVSCPLCCLVRLEYIYLIQSFTILSH